MKKKILLASMALQISLAGISQNFCTQQLVTDNYSSTAPWTQVGIKTQISGGLFKFLNTAGAVYDGQYRASNLTTNNSKYFIAQCKFLARKGNGPGHQIMTFSASSIDPVSLDASGSYAATNNNAIIVDLTAALPPSSPTSSPNPLDVSNPWQFNLRYKIGTTLVTCPQKINSLGLNTWQYIKLERGGIGGNDLKLSIFSNSSYTTQIPGSPITWCSLPLDSIVSLPYVRHQVYTWAGGFRRLTGAIDNLKICQGTDIELCCNQLAINAGADVITCCASAGTQLNATVSGGFPSSISWSPTTGLNSPFILNPISTISGTYVVTITNNCGQSYSDNVTITDNGGGCCRIGGTGIKPIAYPNPFTNDFSITIPEEKTATLIVSNPYGVQFETRNNATGTIQLGNNLKQGSYTITIVYDDGSREMISAIKLTN